MNFNFKHTLLLSFVGLLLFSSCKKDQIEMPQSNDPIFRVDGSMAGGDFSMVAGDDNAYMYTMTSMENGVNVFSGELSNGEFSIEMGVYDGLLDFMNHEAIAQIVNNTSPTFAHSDDQPIAELNKTWLDDLQNVSQINWYVNSTLVGVDVAYIYEPGVYNVCAMVTFNDNSSIEYCNELIIGYEHHSSCSIHSNVNVAGELIASLQGTTSQVSEVKWFLDGFPIGTDQYLSLPVTPELHRLKAQITFANGVKRTKTAIVDGTLNNRDLSDFSIFEENQVQNAYRDFNVKMAVMRNGKFYKSLPADNSSSTINVTGVELYGNNEAGNPVYKVSANISVMLQETVSLKESPLNMSMTFGVEIP